MKRQEKKNMVVVTTEKQFKRKEFFSKKHRYAIVLRDEEFEREYELSDTDYVVTPTGSRAKINEYSTTFVVVFSDDLALVYGNDSPLLYLQGAKVYPPALFEDAVKEFERVVKNKSVIAMEPRGAGVKVNGEKRNTKSSKNVTSGSVGADKTNKKKKITEFLGK